MKAAEKKHYVQYGCGLTAPAEWTNFDVSPTLRLQRIPFFERVLGSKLNTRFPQNVLYGDIIKGLPIPDESCQGLFCSHTLEHLSLEDFRTALKNSFKILRRGGIFRCIVPDLEYIARSYLTALDSGNPMASLDFMNNTLLGSTKRPRGLLGLISSFWGNAHHLWMWDNLSLADELSNAGFSMIRRCQFNDCEDQMFKLVENRERFIHAVALECRK